MEMDEQRNDQQQLTSAVTAFSSSITKTMRVTDTIRIKLTGGGTKFRGEVEYLVPDGRWLDRQAAATVISGQIWSEVAKMAQRVCQHYAAEDAKYMKSIMHQILRYLEVSVQDAKRAFQ